jgi:hypothetical protein
MTAKVLSRTEAFLVGAGSLPGARMVGGAQALGLLGGAGWGVEHEEGGEQGGRITPRAAEPVAPLPPPVDVPYRRVLGDPQLVPVFGELDRLLGSLSGDSPDEVRAWYDANRGALEVVVDRVHVAGKLWAYAPTDFLRKKAARERGARSASVLARTTAADQVLSEQLRYALANVFRQTERPGDVPCALDGVLLGAYTLAVLLGYQEQGIVQVQVRAPLDSDANAVPCSVRALDGVTLAVNELLGRGLRPFGGLVPDGRLPVLEPVIGSVVWPVPETTLTGERSLRSFVQAEPVFDARVLAPSDVVLPSVVIAGVTFERCPVEHVRPLRAILPRWAESPLWSLFPRTVRFCLDVVDDDAFQFSGHAAGVAAGTALTWTDAEGILHVSSYAAEDQALVEVLAYVWGVRLAEGSTGPARATAPRTGSVPLAVLERLQTAGLVETYVTPEGVFALGWSAAGHAADLAALETLGVSPELGASRALDPLWTPETGELLTTNAEPSSAGPDRGWVADFVRWLLDPLSAEVQAPAHAQAFAAWYLAPCPP